METIKIFVNIHKVKAYINTPEYGANIKWDKDMMPNEFGSHPVDINESVSKYDAFLVLIPKKNDSEIPEGDE